MKRKKRIVIKVGSSTLTHDTGLINLRRMETLVKVLADIINAGHEVVLVSSGAVAIGVGKLRLGERPADMPTKQAAAAVGQCELMHIYDTLFSAYNHTVAQVLLTRDVMEHAERKENVYNTFCRLLQMHTIPIVNENDTVAVDEMDFSDNDNLAAIVATLIHADSLIMLSDIEGLYTADPRKDPQARLISRVDIIDESIVSLAGGIGSSRGTGGMISKIQAAKTATDAGIDMHILCGERPENLYGIFDGELIGTLFKAQSIQEG